VVVHGEAVQRHECFNLSFVPTLNVLKTWHSGLKNCRQRGQGICGQQMLEAAKKLKIKNHLLESLPRELAGGQRQRVSDWSRLLFVT